jgi:ankyrin repeat protein
MHSCEVLSFATLEEPSPDLSIFWARQRDGECRLKLIVDSFGFTMANVGRSTPLHRACVNRNSSVDLFRQLIDADPEALTKQDYQGQTPLHLACFYHKDSPEILHCLLDRCPPEVVRMRDHCNGLPLHRACYHACSIEIIRRMID